MLSNTFLGCSIFLITNISLLYTSHLVARRFLPNAPPSVRLVAIGTFFYSLIILIFQALSPFHAITKIWVAISCLLLTVVSHCMWGKQSNLKADIEPIQEWIRDGLTSKWAVLLIICGFVVFLSLSRALLMPPLAWDCLTYHLTFAALWVKKGTLLLFKAPDQIIDNVYFPINGDIFASWLLLPFNNDLLVNIMNFPLTLLGGISCYAIARELGLSRKEASFAPALICFSPMIYSQISTSHVDNAVFTFCSAAVLFTLRYLRQGHLYDKLLALAASGILFGTKHIGIPVAGIIFIVTIIKTIKLVGYHGFLKKMSLIFLGLLIVCTLGGRQYIHNAIDARNPLYPFPLKIFNYEILEGSYKWQQQGEWVSEYEKESGWDKFSWWEREYRRFCYITSYYSFLPISAGPKYFFFLILALVSIVMRPHEFSKRDWYFLSIMWLLPLVLFYINSSADLARRGPWVEYSTRFLSPFLALFTIQGLVLLKKIIKNFKGIYFFLAVFVIWDLLYINKAHIWEVAILYPYTILIILLVISLFILVLEKIKQPAPKKKAFFNSSEPSSLGLLRASVITIKGWAICVMGCIVLVIGLYYLQCYRDNTRYTYYRTHADHQRIPTTLVSGWEYLDNPYEKKTIAMSMDFKPPGGYWFFYPLLGRWLQNDIVYLSAKYKWEVPAWLHRGLLRGDDFSIWLDNLKRRGVDYIFLQRPWSVELQWMQRNKKMFKLIFTDNNCKIFKYTGE